MSNKARLQEKYESEIRSQVMQDLGITNIMAAPKLTKIVINVGMGKESLTNPTAIQEMVADISVIAGQKPIITKSKNAISNFKLRENMDNGIKVTLRNERMWDFYDKLVNVVLPRVKDFRGVSRKAFDTKGNYALGIKEHTVFPEIDTSKMVKIRPMQIIICTSGGNDEAGSLLLEKLGMPFKKESK